MKRLKSSVLLTALLLSSCAEAPEAVLSEVEVLDNVDNTSSEEAHSEESVTETAELRFSALNEIRDSIDTVIADNRSIVQILGTPVLPQGEKMPVYTISASMAESSASEQVLRSLLETLDNPILNGITAPTAYDVSSPIETLKVMRDGTEETLDVSSRGWQTFASGHRVMNDAMTISLGVTNQGYVCNYWQDYGDPPIYYTNSPIQAVIPVTYAGITDGAGYPMKNGEIWAVADAVAFAEAFYNTSFSDIPGGYTYRVSEVIVRDIGEGYGYDFTLQRILPDDNAVLPISALHYNEQTDDYSSVSSGSTCSMWCLLPEQVQEFSVDCAHQMKAEEERPILCAESAIQVVSEALAQQKMYSFYMELGYLYQINGSEYLQLMASSDYQSALDNGDYISAQAVPYWMFYEPVEEIKPRTSGNYYLVNALTGELEIR